MEDGMNIWVLQETLVYIPIKRSYYDIITYLTFTYIRLYIILILH